LGCLSQPKQYLVYHEPVADRNTPFDKYPGTVCDLHTYSLPSHTQGSSIKDEREELRKLEHPQSQAFTHSPFHLLALLLSPFNISVSVSFLASFNFPTLPLHHPRISGSSWHRQLATRLHSQNGYPTRTCHASAQRCRLPRLHIQLFQSRILTYSIHLVNRHRRAATATPMDKHGSRAHTSDFPSSKRPSTKGPRIPRLFYS
jgi:hypothetical protein